MNTIADAQWVLKTVISDHTPNADGEYAFSILSDHEGNLELSFGGPDGIVAERKAFMNVTLFLDQHTLATSALAEIESAIVALWAMVEEELCEMAADAVLAW